MKKNRNKSSNEINYWESMADSMVALLFCIILLAVLLILYIFNYEQNNGNKYQNAGADAYAESTVSEYNTENTGEYASTEPTTEYGERDDDYNIHGGGGDGYDNPVILPEHSDEESPDRAAVFVQVVDSETGRTVKQSGIQFELYNAANSLSILNTYYPEKIEYKKFATDAGGEFYLPEKIELSDYYLKNLSTLPGYDKSDNVEFSLDKAYEWDNPYVVTVSLSPHKSAIAVQLKDSDTGKGLGGSIFNVVAAEDIRTKDDSVRFNKGDVCDTIKLDENGYGESEKLYIGKYRLVQKIVPPYYGKAANVDIDTSERAGEAVCSAEISEEKTRVHLNLTDALYESNALEGAKFSLKSVKDASSKKFVTDSNGEIVITDLEKNTTYHLRQETTNENYLKSNDDLSFTVDADGYIDGSISKDIAVTNIITRVSFEISDYLLRGQISDVSLALYDKDDNVVKSWSSTGLEQLLEGFEAGEYTLVTGGNKSNGQRIVIENKADIQIHNLYIWTVNDTIIVIVLAVVFILFVVFIVFIIKKRRKRRKNKKE